VGGNPRVGNLPEIPQPRKGWTGTKFYPKHSEWPDKSLIHFTLLNPLTWNTNNI
jgi:hypothetical protein